jgi:hypothetical protein
MVWEFDKGMARVMKNGKIGYVNQSGIEFIPCKYDQIWEFHNGRARVLRNGKMGYINEGGNEYIPAQYEKIWEFEDGRALVLRNGRMGMINESGYEFIPAQYQKIWEFEDGRAKVLKNGKMGFINESGFEIIPCEYNQIGEFDEGIARAVKDGKTIYINENGNTVEKAEEEITPPLPNVPEIPETPTVQKYRIYSDKDTTKIKILGSQVQVIKEDDKSTKISFNERDDERHYKKRRLHKRFNGHYWGVDLGFNNYLTSDGDISLPTEYEYLSLNSGKSIELSVNILQQDIPLGSNIGFVTGLGLTFNNYRFDNPYTLVKDDLGKLGYRIIDGNLNKTKLTTTYITAPLLLELQFSKHSRDAFYLSAGVIAGYRVKSHTKIVTEENGKKTKDKDHGSFYLNDFRYGAQVRLGFKSINLYGTYYLSPIFDKNKAPELYPISIGFSFYPDWF